MPKLLQMLSIAGKAARLFALLALAPWHIAHSQAPWIAEAPEPIQKLAADLKGKPAKEVRQEIIKQFGPAQRDIGSGFQIEQWDLYDGVLTFHPAVGPNFKDKAGTPYWLMNSNNPLGRNLLDSYEMTTLPDPENHGSTYWLGNLKFGEDGTYRFVHSGQHAEHRAKQRGNFFIEHPEGKVSVYYPGGFSADTLLESVPETASKSLPEGAAIAELTFTSADGKHSANFAIFSSKHARTLSFWSPEPLGFSMSSSWKNYWQ